MTPDLADRVPGSGPVPCRAMAVGEAPGRNEHFGKRVFIGKAGSVLGSYFQAAGLIRSDIFITNLYPFWPGEGNPDPTAAQIRENEHYLVADLKRVRPEVIATIGAISTRWFLGDVILDDVHGIPHWSDKAPGAVIVPCFHPAAGFYDPSKAMLSQDDFMRFSYCLQHPAEAKKKPRFRIVDRPSRSRVAIEGAVDTEGLARKPWGLSWSKDGKRGEVVRVGDTGAKPKLKGRIVFHHALHDLRVLETMGYDVDDLDYDDTMVMSFNLQLEPQGLKALAYRRLGLRMESFDDVVRPHFNRVALKWLKKAVGFDYPKSPEEAVQDFSKRKWRIYKPWHAGRRIKAILQSYAKKPTETKLEKKWVDLPEEHRAQAEERMGSKFPEFSIFCVPKKKATRYSGTDAVATVLVHRELDREIDARGLREVYEMDRRRLPFIDAMQATGMRVDLGRLVALEVEVADGRTRAMKRVQRVVGDKWFNPGSGDQVAAWLYRAKGLEPLRFTDGGRGSTADEALQMLRGYHGEDEDVIEFIDGVQDYRECDKLHGTFVLPIIGGVRRDKRGNWRLHPELRVTRVVSGRLSSSGIMILGIPHRTALGRKVRSCFVAEEGYVVLSVDESQIELRMMAHHSHDRMMRVSFEEERDLHALTASIIFDIPLDQVTKAQRYVAKTINFATMYGISPRALLEQLYKAGIWDYTLEDCEGFIREWFRIYASVRRYLEGLWKGAEKDGFVRDMWGRMAYVPNIRVMDGRLREAARRLAGNFPIQSGAHGLVERAQVELHNHIKRERLKEEVKPWLEFHDELLLEVRAGEVEEHAGVVKKMMVADQDRVSVPIKAEAAWGPSWGEIAK